MEKIFIHKTQTCLMYKELLIAFMKTSESEAVQFTKEMHRNVTLKIEIN